MSDNRISLVDITADPITTAVKHLFTVIRAGSWALIGGGIGTLTDALDDANTYEAPLDWVHLRKLFLMGAVMGLVGWYRKEVALATPVPTKIEVPAGVPVAVVPVAVAPVVTLPAAIPIPDPAPTPTTLPSPPAAPNVQP